MEHKSMGERLEPVQLTYIQTFTLSLPEAYDSKMAIWKPKLHHFSTKKTFLFEWLFIFCTVADE